MKILMTGRSGFVGNALNNALNDYVVTSVVRRPQGKNDGYVVEDLDPNTDWSYAMVGVDVVIHVAALAHKAAEQASFEELERVNVSATIKLAKDAALSDVKRFIFLSSIGVNGNGTGVSSFTADCSSAPHNLYSESKYLAEEALKSICAETGMELVIIRPPLVYGAGVKANFLSMLKWVARGVPLPLGGIKNNKRSLVYIENLVDLIKVCIEHPAAANQTFLVSDDDDVSTRELLERVAKALGVKSRILPIPPSWLGFAGRLLGKKDIEQRLCGSLQVDIEHTKNTLGWKPRYSMEDGLARTADWYKNRR